VRLEPISIEKKMPSHLRRIQDVLVSVAAGKNYHKHDDLKQHTFILLQL
jgi:hypothetical protein